MTAVPRELNWVEARSLCTIAKVFNQFCDGIENDVKIVNQVRGSAFRVDTDSSGNAIFVAQPSQLPRQRIRVGVEGERIAVADCKGSRWVFSVGLNVEGRCILKLEDGTELEHWQARKMVLEVLFFGD